MRSCTQTLQRKTSPLRIMILYHGSSREFSQFSLSKVLSGEGNVSFGHGIYLAESPELGKHYSSVAYEANIARLFEVKSNIESAEYTLKEDRVVRRGSNPMTSTERMALQHRIKELHKEIETATTGLHRRLYKLEVPDRILPYMINFDTTLDKQTMQIKACLRKMKIEINNDDGISFYKDLENNYGTKEASDILIKSGMQGTRYFDAVSRKIGKGTTNFVIFNPRLIKILSSVKI